MTISTELLNSTFADLRGPLVNSFVRSNELFEALNAKARMPMEGGTKIERSFSGDAPARGVGVYGYGHQHSQAGAKPEQW